MTRLLPTAALTLLSLIPAAASAQPDGGPRGWQNDMTRAQYTQMLDQRFARLDANGDGTVTPEERRAAAEARRAAHAARHGGGMGGGAPDRDSSMTKADFEQQGLARFDRMDTNHDGVVTPDERRAAFEAMRAGRDAPN